MLTYDILSTSLTSELLPQLEATCESHGLVIADAGTLNSFPGSHHWRLRRAKMPGVLEVTYRQGETQVWVSVHDNRDGGWARQACPKFARALARRVSGQARKRSA